MSRCHVPHFRVTPALLYGRKRAEESGLSNVKAGVEDGMLLSGFGDGTVDAVTCTWGMESMPDHVKALQVSIPAYCWYLSSAASTLCLMYVDVSYAAD